MPNSTSHRPQASPAGLTAGLIFLVLLGSALSAPGQAAQLEIQHWETSNGARVYFVPSPELPMVDVRIVFDAGSARDGDHPGVAQLTNRLLDDGAGELDADAIAEGFEDLGARFNTDSLRDMAIVNLRSLSDPQYLAPAVDTLALILRDPTFPEAAVERERGRQLTELQQDEQSPGDLASMAFYQAIYGTHPYAGDPLGTPASVAATDRADIEAHYRRFYVGKNAIIALVGDLTRSAAGKLVEQVIAGIPAGSTAEKLPPSPTQDAPQVRHIAFPSSQTHILAGQTGMRRNDPDYFPLYVGNHILGGSGLVSRISERIRDQRGLAYSAYSYFTPMSAAGPYTLGLQTRNDQAEEAIGILFETVETFIEEGPTDEELDASVKNITGGFPLQISSNGKIVDILAMIGFYGLPLDYLDHYNDRVRSVTREQIRDAYQRRIDPDRMVTVTVGRSAQ